MYCSVTFGNNKQRQKKQKENHIITRVFSNLYAYICIHTDKKICFLGFSLVLLAPVEFWDLGQWRLLSCINVTNLWWARIISMCRNRSTALINIVHVFSAITAMTSKSYKAKKDTAVVLVTSIVTFFICLVADCATTLFCCYFPCCIHCIFLSLSCAHFYLLKRFDLVRVKEK